MGTKPDEQTVARTDVDRDAGREDRGTDGRAGARPKGPGKAKPPDRTVRGRLRSSPLLAAAVVLVVIAAGCAGWFGWSWYAAAHDESLRYSRARDQALAAGEQAIQNLNTLDYQHIDQGLDIWLRSTTGRLRGEILRGRTEFVQQIRQAKTVTTAKVLDGALTELNVHAGKASIIVALRITVTPADGEPATKRSRLEGELTRTASGWKLSGVGQVPAGTAFPAASAPNAPQPGAGSSPGPTPE